MHRVNNIELHASYISLENIHHPAFFFNVFSFDDSELPPKDNRLSYFGICAIHPLRRVSLFRYKSYYFRGNDSRGVLKIDQYVFR